jgi:L-threonylcarbamoyladenylate synthase
MKVLTYENILEKDNIEILRMHIAADGVLAYPTDTLYGLGGRFPSKSVIEKIDSVKNRKDMPYSLMIPGPDMLDKLVESVPSVFPRLYRELLPGKFTFLFEVSSHINRALLKESGKIGIRIPDVPNMIKLLEILDTPLITTSVNRSGEPSLNDPAEIIRRFGQTEDRTLIPLLIDAGVLPTSGGSTILDLTESPIKCIRKGDNFQQFLALGIDFV